MSPAPREEAFSHACSYVIQTNGRVPSSARMRSPKKGRVLYQLLKENFSPKEHLQHERDDPIKKRRVSPAPCNSPKSRKQVGRSLPSGTLIFRFASSLSFFSSFRLSRKRCLNHCIQFGTAEPWIVFPTTSDATIALLCSLFLVELIVYRLRYAVTASVSPTAANITLHHKRIVIRDGIV